MKLLQKEREGSHVHRTYAQAQTPLERVCTSDIVDEEQHHYLDQVAALLDPMRLLEQIGQLRQALWRHAVLPPYHVVDPGDVPSPVRFDRDTCGGQEMTDEGIMATPSGSLASKRKHKMRQEVFLG